MGEMVACGCSDGGREAPFVPVFGGGSDEGCEAFADGGGDGVVFACCCAVDADDGRGA